jgi:hypothetical protein
MKGKGTVYELGAGSRGEDEAARTMTVFRLILRHRLFAVLTFTSVGLFIFAISYQ